MAERPWTGEPAELAADGFVSSADRSQRDRVLSPYGLVVDGQTHQLVQAGRDLFAERRSEHGDAVWKRVGQARFEHARVLGWVKSPLEPRAAVFLEDDGVRVVGVHLGSSLDVPATAAARYAQARLGVGIAHALDDGCSSGPALDAALRHLTRAIEQDRGLAIRARRDFEELQRSLGFRVLVGALDLGDPDAVASAIASVQWVPATASCGGGTYDYEVRFTSSSVLGYCPNELVTDEEASEPEGEGGPAQAAPPSRSDALSASYRVKGTTLELSDGSTMELSVSGGVAELSGGPYPFVEKTFVCR